MKQAWCIGGLEGIRSNNGNLSQNTQYLGQESDQAQLSTNTKVIDSVFKLFSPYLKNLHYVLFIVVLCVDINQRNYVHSFPKHKEKRGQIKSNKKIKEANEMK